MIFLTNSNTQGLICNDKNPSGIKRFPPSPLLNQLKRYKTLKTQFENFDSTSIIIDDFKNKKKYSKYVVPTGVTHSPLDWTGYQDLDKQYDSKQIGRLTPFAYLDKKLLRDLQKNKAYLLLDQSHEGYHEEWLFDWFHDACKKYQINADRIIYVTGNLAVEKQYKEWCNKNSPKFKLYVVPHIHFEEFICDQFFKQKHVLPTVQEHLDYKSRTTEIKTYNCFQKRPRPHRIWMFYELYKNSLLNEGINSMNSFSFQNTYYEGRFIEKKDYKEIVKDLPIYPKLELSTEMKTLFESGWGGIYEQDLYCQETKDSWISVVSEASFAENTCFISEKTFKPIAARHPFIIYGNKHSLRYLRELGYKTFSTHIDESYDDLDTWDRLNSIIKILKDISKMSHTEKIQWYASMQDILDYNIEILQYNSTKKISTPIINLLKYVS